MKPKAQFSPRTANLRSSHSLSADGDNKETLSEVPNRYVRKWGQQNDCDRKYLSRWFSISYQDDSRAAAGHPEEAHRRLKLSSSPDSKDMVSFPTAVLQRATSLYSDTDPRPVSTRPHGTRARSHHTASRQMRLRSGAPGTHLCLT